MPPKYDIFMASNKGMTVSYWAECNQEGDSRSTNFRLLKHQIDPKLIISKSPLVSGLLNICSWSKSITNIHRLTKRAIFQYVNEPVLHCMCVAKLNQCNYRRRALVIDIWSRSIFSAIQMLFLIILPHYNASSYPASVKFCSSEILAFNTNIYGKKAHNKNSFCDGLRQRMPVKVNIERKVGENH